MEYLNTIDYTVIVVYFLFIMGMGFYFSRKASASLEDYFLGGRQIPWWALGISGMASFLDITGTMLIVSFLYMLGPRGLFIEFRGGAVLILAVMLVFAGKWHNRSKCMTGAEWMAFRFGEGGGGKFARIVTAVAAMVGAVGTVAYLSKGVGLFLSMFLPVSPLICAILLIGVAMFYTMISGFYGVVYTDMVQSVIILIAIVTVIIMAVGAISNSPQPLAELAQEVTGSTQWTESTPHWQTTMPRGYSRYSMLGMFALFYLVKNVLIAAIYAADPKYFGARSERECGKLTFLWTCLMMFRWPMMMGFAVLGLFLVKDKFPDQSVLHHAQAEIKTYFVSQAGHDQQIDYDGLATIYDVAPGQSWHDVNQSVESSADPQLAGLLQTQFGPQYTEKVQSLAANEELLGRTIPRTRWDEEVSDIINHPDDHPEIAATMKDMLGDEWQTKLKMVSYDGTINPERILPAVILFDIPIGLRGLLLIALIAASMSTFDSALNLASGYFTRDIYQRFWRPTAHTREMIFATYGFIIIIVILGFGLGYASPSINDIWGWLTMGLAAGMLVPGMLKFFWWRFNSGGLVLGTLTGMTAAVIQRIYWPELDERFQFLYLTAAGGLGAFLGTYLSKPDDAKVVENFYRTTRPFGAWGPLRKTLAPDQQKATNRENRNDIIAVPFTLGWQITLFLIPMQLIIKAYSAAAITSVIFVVCLLGMYIFWYRNLPPAGAGVRDKPEEDPT